jgi:hypothetical protein
LRTSEKKQRYQTPYVDEAEQEPKIKMLLICLILLNYTINSL